MATSQQSNTQPLTKEKVMSAKVVRKKKNDTADNEDTPDIESWELAHLVPEAEYGETYVSRMVGGVRDLKVLQYASDNGDNVILKGPTGSAKTSLIYAFAAGAYDAATATDEDGKKIMKTLIDRKRARPLVYIPCNGSMDASTLLGRWVPKPGGGYRYALGLIPLVCLYGGVLYFDEVNFAPPKITAAIHGLLDRRRTVVILDAAGSGVCAYCGWENDGCTEGEDCYNCEKPIQSTQYGACDDTQIVAAYNPDYSGTVALNEAFLNRWPIKMNFGYNDEVEQQLVKCTRLREIAMQLRASYDNRVLTTPISTNLLIDFERLSLDEDMGVGFAIQNLVNNFPTEEQASVGEVMAANTEALYTEYSEMMYEYEDADDGSMDDGEDGE